MITILIRGQLLDLYPGTILEFVLNNPAFAGGDIDTILGAYQFPFNIPSTPKNKTILDFPERIDHIGFHLTDEPCQVMSRGVTIFNGLATVKSAGKNIRMSILIDSYKQLKEVKTNDLPLDTISHATIQDALNTAKDTAVNPLNYNYIFFPVLNRSFFSADQLPEPGSNAWMRRYQNYYDVDTQAFVSSEFQRCAMPFVRIDHIIDKIQSQTDFNITNNLQTSDELKQLVCFNTTNIYNNDSWSLNWDLSKHVPVMNCAEFLKRITRLFCCGMFLDRFRRDIEIIPLKQIITAPFKHDWTQKASPYPIVLTPDDFPGSFGYSSDEDEMFEQNMFQSLHGYFQNPLADYTEAEKQSDVSFTIGDYYINAINEYFRVINPPTVYAYQKMFRRIFLGIGENYDFKTSPLFMRSKSQYSETQFLKHTPQAAITQDSKKEIRLAIYRGILTDLYSKSYPVANNNNYDATETPIPTAEHSLLWNGNKGLYQQFWSEWVTFLQNKKESTTTVNLTIADVLNFSFKNKVRIRENNYLVKQMKVSISDGGILPTKLKLASVLM